MHICTLFFTVDYEVTIGFVQQSYKVVEGGGGVALEVVVREGEIPVSHTVEITLTTNDQSAIGVLYF